jgi:hypothetical protein
MEQKERLQQLLTQTTALLGAMRYSIDSASAQDIWKYASYKTFLRKYVALAQSATPLLSDTSLLDGFELDKIKGSCDTVAIQQKELFDLAYSNLALLKSLIEAEIGYAEDETQKLTDFIEGKLRRAVFGNLISEADIQNSIEVLLVGRGMARGLDYDRETGRVKTSGKESIPDFIFPSLQLCLEIKIAKTVDRLKVLVDEINADIRAYGTRYDRQLYLIYDLGTIRDEPEFKRDIESTPGVRVIVVKH